MAYGDPQFKKVFLPLETNLDCLADLIHFGYGPGKSMPVVLVGALNAIPNKRINRNNAFDAQDLGDHPRAAIHDHLKTGHTGVVVRDVDADQRLSSLRRYEQRFERREKTTSHCTGTARMDLAADRASDRCASRNRGELPQGSRDRSAATVRMG